jgi:tetratricopeptide (TPR) repeat protein
VSRVPPRQPTPEIDSLLQQALGMHQAGRMAEAIEIHEDILARIPNHFDETHLLGVIGLQEGRLQQAQDWITAALRTNPQHAAALK